MNFLLAYIMVHSGVLQTLNNLNLIILNLEIGQKNSLQFCNRHDLLKMLKLQEKQTLKGFLINNFIFGNEINALNENRYLNMILKKGRNECRTKKIFKNRNLSSYAIYNKLNVTNVYLNQGDVSDNFTICCHPHQRVANIIHIPALWL